MLDLNDKLDDLAESGAQLIRSMGYEAIAQTTGYVKISGIIEQITIKPSQLSGFGMDRKSALLVTKKYGAALRLTSILTNMPLDYGVPIERSMCPQECNNCRKACPGEAISGKLWDRETDRDEFFDPLKCREKARQLAWERIKKEITLCGKCIEVCPFTQVYSKKN